ncbi:MFS transporter [Leifsonia aquatica]|uniref:Transporter, major facilitator family protein n=2 Tax=Leifsonia aquatica TaxID=144185 RepID=U2T3H2_LEIAQ|nr:MFS transporter [Leifsonia aquatica]ERK72013.1 transporter, major facilitator family protein [Leifsonia aquatica ATCC 14665]MBB2968071.1 putative MFS family arabinose efflux permease [Leifsonia aquatica]
MSHPNLSTAAAPAASASPTLRGGRAVGLVATLVLGVLSYQLNASMLSPALPDMAKELNVDVGSVSQVTSLFFLAGSIGGVVLSRWSDFVGRRRSLIIVLAILAVGTLLCIFAPNLPILLVGRVLQGASSAAFQLAYIILSESLSAKIFGTTLGIITAVNGGVGGLDGWVGGLLTDNFGFRSVFVVIFVFGIVALLAVIVAVPRGGRPTPTGTMDWWGAAALSVALIGLTYFVSNGSSLGWVAPLTLVFLAVGVVAFVAFWLIEKRRTSPLIAVEHLRSRQVWPVIVTTVLTLSGIFAVINFTVVLLSQNAEIGFGLDAATSALLFLTPAALIGVFAAPLSGWLAGRAGWLRILRIGLLLSTIALIVIAFVPTNQGLVLAAVAFLGITYNGLVLTTVNGLGVLLSPPDAPAALPGLNGAAFGIGASLGIGIVAPFAASGSLGGVTTALWISVVITVLALITSLLIRPRAGQRI